MAGFLENIAEYLEDQGVGTAATDIFAYVQPPDPDNCVAIIGATGDPANMYVKELEFPRFQVLIRNAEFADGEAKMAAVRAALHGHIGLTLTDYRVLRLHAQNEGGPIGIDDKGRYEFSINFHGEARAT